MNVISKYTKKKILSLVDTPYEFVKYIVSLKRKGYNPKEAFYGAESLYEEVFDLGIDSYIEKHSGFIYIARSNSLPEGIVKIGMTTKSVEQRFKTLNTALPSSNENVQSYYSKDAMGTEKIIHEKLNQYHVAKEFFRVPIEIADGIIREIIQSEDSRLLAV